MTRGRLICKVLTTMVVISTCMMVLASCGKMDEINATPVQQRTETKIFEDYEQMPSFPGGVSALMAYIKENVKYPVDYEEVCVQGRVVITFVVEKDGSISDAKVVKSVYPSLDKEALRVVSGMPKWLPGKFWGKSVRVRYSIPIPFQVL